MIWIPVVAVALFLAVGVTFRLLENRLIYFPRPLDPGVLDQLTAELPAGEEVWREISFVTEDGETLVGWFGRPPNPRGWVLWSHGNAGNIIHRWPDFHRLVRSAGLAVLIYDYRGYGRSTGSPDERGLYLDSRAAFEALEGQGADPAEIVLLGRSLGAAVSLELASDRPVRGLVLESTFTSLGDMARTVVPLYPSHWFTRSRFPSLDRIAIQEAPILLLHGTEDELVPFEQGKRLAAAARRSRCLQFIPVEKAGHNDVSEVTGPGYFEKVRAFVEEAAHSLSRAEGNPL